MLVLSCGGTHHRSYLPIVVITVPAKKMDWPKLQLGVDLVTFFTAEIPLFVAWTIFVINSSNSASGRKVGHVFNEGNSTTVD